MFRIDNAQCGKRGMRARAEVRLPLLTVLAPTAPGTKERRGAFSEKGNWVRQAYSERESHHEHPNADVITTRDPQVRWVFSFSPMSCGRLSSLPDVSFPCGLLDCWQRLLQSAPSVRDEHEFRVATPLSFRSSLHPGRSGGR